jgi:hypothetical protein
MWGALLLAFIVAATSGRFFAKMTETGTRSHIRTSLVFLQARVYKSAISG